MDGSLTSPSPRAVMVWSGRQIAEGPASPSPGAKTRATTRDALKSDANALRMLSPPVGIREGQSLRLDLEGRHFVVDANGVRRADREARAEIDVQLVRPVDGRAHGPTRWHRVQHGDRDRVARAAHGMRVLQRAAAIQSGADLRGDLRRIRFADEDL